MTMATTMEQHVAGTADLQRTADEPAPPFAASGVALAQLRRRLFLAAQGQATVQDQLDCAELAVAAGFPDAARTLYELAFVRTGCSPARLRWQARIARATGLWDAADDAGAADDRDGFSIDLAVDDLRALFRLPIDTAPVPALDAAAMPVATVPAVAPRVLTADELRAVPARVTQLLALLRQPPGDAVAEEMRALLAEIARDLLDRTVPALGDRLGGTIPDVVACFAATMLRDFLRSNRVLGFAPWGSPALLHAAARVHEGGLGAYFWNVQQLIRRGRDVLAMIQLASGGEAVPPDRIERWSALLGLHLDRPSRIDLVNDLADLGLMRAVHGILDGASAQTAILRDRDLLWCIRDAALDTATPHMAVAAQALIAVRWPHERLEWLILADLLAADGDTRGAVRALLAALKLQRRDPGARERLAALRSGRYGGYLIKKGFGTPRHRQLVRLARRAAAADGAVPPA